MSFDPVRRLTPSCDDVFQAEAELQRDDDEFDADAVDRVEVLDEMLTALNKMMNQLEKVAESE